MLIYLDIETNGLPSTTVLGAGVTQTVMPRVLEVAAHCDGRDFHVIIEAPISEFDDFITKMHKESGLLDDLVRHSVSLDEAKRRWRSFLYNLGHAPHEKLQPCGKNVAQFDIPILSAWGFDTSRFSHRVLDIGSLVFPRFGFVPRLDEVTGKRVMHRAADEVKQYREIVKSCLPQ